MRRNKKTLWVLGTLLTVALLALGTIWIRLRPLPIVIPPRQYPPNNAYEAYKKLAEKMHRDLRGDQRLITIRESFLHKSVSKSDEAYYIQRMQPYLKAYRQFLDQPSVAVYEYDINWLFPELSRFRQLAWAEALLIRKALSRQQPREAVERARTMARFAEQIRNGGASIHYLVGSHILRTAYGPLQESLNEIDDPVALQAIVDMALRYERERATLEKTAQADYYVGLSAFRDLRTGKLKISDLTNNPRPDFVEQLLLMEIRTSLGLSSARKEYEQLWEARQAELRKPMWARKAPTTEPRRHLNRIINIPFDSLLTRERIEVAEMRLLGCAAAIKLYKQRTGQYPNSLSELNLGDMVIDPFTGKPFIYRVDQRRGFQLYSVGVNLLDDGGRIARDEVSGGDITAARLPSSQRPHPSGGLSAPLWLR